MLLAWDSLACPCHALCAHFIIGSVGVYDEDTSALLGAGASMMLDSEDLLPGMKMTKAVVTQYYAKGAECTVTEFNEVYHNLDQLTMLRCDIGTVGGNFMNMILLYLGHMQLGDMSEFCALHSGLLGQVTCCAWAPTSDGVPIMQWHICVGL